MSKTRIFLIVLIAFMLFAIISAVSIFNSTPVVRSFDIGEWQHYIDYFQEYIEHYPTYTKVDPIIDGKDALEKAEGIWIELYGEYVKKQKPYQVFYDEANGVWLVEGTFWNLFGNKKGGVAYFMVRNNGEIVALGHGK